MGSPVDILTRDESLSTIASWIGKEDKMKLVVTAYSEFYVRAMADPDFKIAMDSADLVTPDGVSVLAAARYSDQAREKNVFSRLFKGLKTGGEILSGKIGEPVTGVWLFENLVKQAAQSGWKVFLLGGWNNVSGRTARMLLKRFPKLKIEYDAGEERVGTDEKKNLEVIEKINKFAPDILFVSYNPIKQEKWLMKHRQLLKAKVGIGVGGTFNEYLGEFKKAPLWMEKSGLKWFWRLIQEPKRFGRVWTAFPVFPWLVFKKDK